MPRVTKTREKRRGHSTAKIVNVVYVVGITTQPKEQNVLGSTYAVALSLRPQLRGLRPVLRTLAKGCDFTRLH